MNEPNLLQLLDKMYVCFYLCAVHLAVPALIVPILASCVNSKLIHKQVEATNHEHPTFSMVALLLLLPDSSCVEVTQQWELRSTCQKDGESVSSVCAIMVQATSCPIPMRPHLILIIKCSNHTKLEPIMQYTTISFAALKKRQSPWCMKPVS